MRSVLFHQKRGGKETKRKQDPFSLESASHCEEQTFWLNKKKKRKTRSGCFSVESLLSGWSTSNKVNVLSNAKTQRDQKPNLVVAVIWQIINAVSVSDYSKTFNESRKDFSTYPNNQNLIYKGNESCNLMTDEIIQRVYIKRAVTYPFFAFGRELQSGKTIIRLKEKKTEKKTGATRKCRSNWLPILHISLNELFFFFFSITNGNWQQMLHASLPNTCIELSSTAI